MCRPVIALAVVMLLVAGCSDGGKKVSGPPPTATATMHLTSDAFAAGGTIPKLYTCDGENRSPALRWTGVPAGTAELVLFVDDPDAPGRRFVHWVLAGIPTSASSIAAATVPAGSRRVVDYRGPCPPQGSKDDPHHYEFRLYALRTRASLGSHPSAGDVRAAIARDRPLAEGVLIGRYGR